MTDSYEADYIMVGCYECPKDTSAQAKAVLRGLALGNGTLIFTHDDGSSILTRDELIDIAGAIGLDCHIERYRLTLVDTNGVQHFRGDA